MPAQDFIHPQACVESTSVGEGTRVWAHAHIMANAKVGACCNIGEGVFIERGAVLGDGVTVKNGVSIWNGLRIGDYAFIGPNACFTNDKYPRSPRLPEVAARYARDENWLEPTIIEQGATIGANATILCGLTIGAYALVAAGAVVLRDVPPHTVVAGNPARAIGRVCLCGRRLPAGTSACACGRTIPDSAMPAAAGVFIHPKALVESDAIGAGTRIWAFAHVMKGARIGPDCNICDHAFIESGATLGRGVTVKTHAAIGDGVTLRDGVFVGPHVVFTNDLRPRSPRLPLAAPRYARKENWLQPTLVEEGVTLGAGVVVSCGITIGAWSFAAAGATLFQDVPSYALMAGNPARQVGYVCACGASLNLSDGEASCTACGRAYRHDGRRLQPVKPEHLWGS